MQVGNMGGIARGGGGGGFGNQLRVKSKIVIGFYQILFALTNTLGIRWPKFTADSAGNYG